jgi:hypothetical protein
MTLFWTGFKGFVGRDMDQAVSRLSLTVESRVRTRVNPCGISDKVALGQVSLRVLRFPLSGSVHRRSPCSDVICGITNMSVSGSSSET